MSDNDLQDLMKEMDFKTPICPRKGSEETEQNERRVLIADQSQNELKMEYLPDSEIMASSVATINSNENPTELVPFTSGTLPLNNRDMKKYKLFIVDEPDETCGMVMGQGITFCTELKC